MTVASYCLGWQKSLPDFRDLSLESPEVRALFERLPPLPHSDNSASDSESLAAYFPDVDDQLQINSSSAQACVDLVQYFERRALGRTVKLSKLFVHQTTQRLLGASGINGTDLRSTLKAIATFGIPYEQHWPYEVERAGEEPTAFLYACAERLRPIQYVRLDGRNGTGQETLAVMKSMLRAGFPCVFGFSVPTSVSRDADIPYRPTFDTIQGGQAVVAVGFDDRRFGSTKGALQVRNSWGRDWGDDGYGWLPYAYVEEQLAADFWTVVSEDWLDSEEFWRPDLPVLARSDDESR